MTLLSASVFRRSITVWGFAAGLLAMPLPAGDAAAPLPPPAEHRRTLSSPQKKLIEFGWDEPDTGMLQRLKDQFEQSPFDGCVFHAVTHDAQRCPRISRGSVGDAGGSPI